MKNNIKNFMNEHRNLLLVILSILFVSITTIASYAYFTANVSGNGIQNVVTTGHMEIKYTDGNLIGTNTNMLPGSYIEKQFTVENIGNVPTEYNIYLNDVINNFADKSDLVYELISEDGTNILQTTCPSVNTKIASNIALGVGITHHYTLKITFLNVNESQDDNKGKSFSAKLSLIEAQFNNNLAIQNDINYTDSLNSLLNPDRGWYYTHTFIIDPTTNAFVSDGSKSLESRIESAKENNSSLMQLKINISELSGNANSTGEDKDFTTTQLESLNSIMNTLRNNNMKAIIRFAYDYEGIEGKEPKSFSTIINHINQLHDFFDDNKDAISLIEAGFLGEWGEMHTSIYEEDTYYYQLIDALLSNVPSSITINVRTPRHYKIYFNTLNNNNDNKYRVGIFNDGYLASITDYGTFQDLNERNEFVSWMQTQGKYTFYGGEATIDDDENTVADQAVSEGPNAVNEMILTHTNYLHHEYDEKVLDEKWKVQYYSGGEYNNQTYYKYIEDHLGYRYVIRNSMLSASVGQGENASLRLTIENTGFGNIIPNQNTYIIIQKDNKYYQALTNIDFRTINGGNSTTIPIDFSIPSDITTGEWNVYLKVCNQLNCDYSVQFANANIYNNVIKANYVGKISIETNTSSNITFKQLGVDNAPDGTMHIIENQQVEEPEEVVDVKIVYYEKGTNTKLSQQNVNIAPNTVVDFTNASQLSSLGITLPSDYQFDYLTSEFLNWESSYDTVTIPEGESSTRIEVYVKQGDTISVKLKYYYDGTKLSTSYYTAQPGETITTSSDIYEVPSGHTIDYLTSELSNWDATQSITLPSSNYADEYSIEVYLK